MEIIDCLGDGQPDHGEGVLHWKWISQKLQLVDMADVVVDQEVFWPQGRLHICQKLHEKLQLKEARLGGSLAPEEDFPLSDDATT